MADSLKADLAPIMSKSNKRVVLALANLFLYSVAMFTLPFVAFFGVRHLLTDVYPHDYNTANIWAVFSAVVVVNLIIAAYAFKAYYEKEYDADGNEIDQHKYSQAPVKESEKSDLNLKRD